MRSFSKHPVERTAEKGYTLVELLVVIAVSLILMVPLTTTYIAQNRTAVAQERVAAMQQNIRAGLYVMEREIRMAGYDPDGTAGAGLIEANSTTFEFSYVADNDDLDNDNDEGVDQENELQSVRFELYPSDGRQRLGRKVFDAKWEEWGNNQVLADDIDAIEFLFGLDDGTETTSPTDLSKIVYVRISLLARTASEEPGYTDTNQYVPMSGADWNLDSGNNPPNDGYRRRLQVTTINLRN